MLWLEAYLAHSFHYWEIVISQYLVGGRSRAHVIGPLPRMDGDALRSAKAQGELVPDTLHREVEPEVSLVHFLD
jgi:hypothetical protein